ncbi:exodeoxyribonuclease V subunit gamma [Acidihalobacter prosperus]|uniref:RecBCD enzyme subunit RecC n=1 Tax=Acidihalobacter prosperus TaxID=160660 RepID=A0A1A6C3Q2_9GAMM|nr:exodeoxyribonuclease V subunit gamma [Acidihalobacter prosperus]OBS09188.1 Exodeoxyribonuclease V gamma chain [Acidihalobacter prosperus]
MFQIHHSNRAECLLDALAEVCAAAPADPFAAETVVVQNPGMARWLALGLAECTGVAAHLDFPLLASFVWRVYAAEFDDLPEQSPLDREILLWRLMALLPAQLADPAFAPLRHYLKPGADEPLRRYQLARRIADLFDQYLVFRAERVLAWEDGAENHWQARLWRTLCAGERPRHRARLHAEFVGHAGTLRRGDLPARVSLFGLTAIPPAYVEVLRALAEVIDVHLFVLDPSVAYWGDIVDERTRARLAAGRARHARPGEAEHREVGNPLLASLGKQGRDFIDLLHAGDDEHREHYAPPERLDLLGLLQLDMLLLQTRGEGADEQPPVPLAPDDVSLQVHSAHSPMREVQVLHDRLLGLFETLPGLTPRDVVVMAPDIDAYAPYVEAVFGAVPSERRIPWSIADRRAAAESPLAGTLLALLGLPQSRFAVSEVLALLEDAAMMRRLGLDEAGLDRVRRWVREANVRWGLDGAMRAALGLPAEEAASWAFGLRRLLLGYAMPADAAAPVAGIAPYVDVEGGEARDLGQLADFVERLADWRERLARPRTVDGWAETLSALLDAFFLPDEDGARLLQQVREALDALRRHAAAGGFAEAVELAVVRDHLRGRLEDASPGQAFLDGRVSFCNMVPMRSIPFRVVCLLGLNDGEYPRAQRPLSFDLMAESPRRGDRSRREDDRYLFLEALLSARDVFYASYVGRDVRSNARRVPSVLLGELLETIERGFRAPDGGRDVLARIVTEHPLQPFSPRYFAADARPASYAAEWLRDPAHPGVGAFLDAPLPEAEGEEEALDLGELADCLLHPARYLLERRLGVFLHASDARAEDAEAFALDGLTAWQLKDRALALALEDGDAAVLESLALADGSLPSAGFGRLAFDDAVAGIPDFAETLRDHGANAPRASLEVDLDLGGCRLRGWLHGVGADGLLAYRVGRLRARERLRLWLQHLALNALAPEGVACGSVFLAEKDALRFGPLPDAAGRLRELVALYREAWRAPLPFFPETSLAYAERVLRKGEDEGAAFETARKVWEGNAWSGSGGERDDAYNALAFRGREALDARFAELALAVYGPMIDAEIEGDGA